MPPLPGRILVLFFLVLLTGCNAPNLGNPLDLEPSQVMKSPGPIATVTTSEALIQPLAESSPAATPDHILVSLADQVPEGIASQVGLPDGYQWAEKGEDPAYELRPLARDNPDDAVVEWVFALAAPFPTIADGIEIPLAAAWTGQGDMIPDIEMILISADSKAVVDSFWGAADANRIVVVAPDLMVEQAWQTRGTWAIVPFEALEPRWKVMRVGGTSPIDQDFKRERYELTFRFGWYDLKQDKFVRSLDGLGNPVVTNRDEDKFTSLILTGTTALVRNTAMKMEENGVLYPGEDIREWLTSADFSHVSNEVSFYTQCPPARAGQRFCTNPDYIQLLDYVGIDIVELTGNHLLDWGPEPFLYSLELYHEQGFLTYGGGIDLEDARQPIKIEHNGNRLAILGCNRSGPENIWATEKMPGPSRCDLDWMEDEIQRLKRDGYLVVVTFQHYEVEDFQPMNLTKQEFQRIGEAGAVVVSGSQAHFAHGFGFADRAFLHYGLGNLFFDQMFPLHRRQFLDRHIFYNGRYLGVELLTAMLEDSARPRPMSAQEREEMLADYFRASGW